jgi:hypothetical protein
MKSEFKQDLVKYLGFIIQAGKGVHVDPKKVEVIRVWEIPKSIRDVRSFIRFANFYRPFIPRFADILALLTRLMKKDAVFKWDNNCQQAFAELKDLFINTLILAYFKEGRDIVVEADASGWVTGAVLS